MTIDFDQTEWLRRTNVAWRLLRADNAAVVISFLGRVFVEENVRSISGVELTVRLEEELFALNERLGAGTFPRSAKAYLDDWAHPEVGWLRKYYPPGSDEVHFDATPAVERALSWVQSLQARSFVGTESRLNIVLELLRQMVYGAETDPDARLAELQARRDAIDAEMTKVRSGRVELLDGAGQRDRYQQFVATARGLLADFREVEANFRALDRELRERIATWSGSKGALLDEVVGSRHAITESDQGRSFHAFYDFLLSPQRQQEFSDLLARVQSLEVIGDADPRMRRIHYDWLDAAERTQATVRLLSEQLRRFLDDQVWLENRRVMDILRDIEAHALALRECPTGHLVQELDATAPQIALPMERPLYRPRKTAAGQCGLRGERRSRHLAPVRASVRRSASADRRGTCHAGAQLPGVPARGPRDAAAGARPCRAGHLPVVTRSGVRGGLRRERPPAGAVARRRRPAPHRHAALCDLRAQSTRAGR